MTAHARVVIAILLCAVGCARAIRVEIPNVEAEAGVPVRFGDASVPPDVTWDFGDQTTRAAGSIVDHAFPSAGQFSVRALDGEKVVGSATVTVRPRTVLRAIPREARFGVYVSNLQNGRALAELFGRFGMGVAQLTEQSGMGERILAIMKDPEQAARWSVDSEEGAAVFVLRSNVPDDDVFVTALGIQDPRKALEAAAADLKNSGAHVETAGDVLQVLGMTGLAGVVFADRGYLYGVSSRAGPAESLDQARETIVKAAPEGLASVTSLDALRAKLPNGAGYAFAREKTETNETLILAAIRPTSAGVEVQGLSDEGKPSWSTEGAATPTLFNSAPERPIIAMSVSVSPQSFAAAVDKEEILKSQAGGMNVTPEMRQGLQSIFSALSGGFAAAVYFDATAFLSNMGKESMPQPKGMVLAQAGVRDSEKLNTTLTLGMNALGIAVKRATKSGVTSYKFQLRDVPSEVSVTKDLLNVRMGELTKKRATVDLRQTLSGQAPLPLFQPGHFSLFLDLGQLRRDIMDAPPPSGKGNPGFAVSQAVALGLLEMLGPIESVFFDATPTDRGAQFQGTLTLRNREL